ncbi:MAG: SDR family NAD(P)-dependent oxidoreductase [Treponema sp.]|nr:SDR family NAD(P)-dependent oxidoreductase [Treponema sp.]
MKNEIIAVLLRGLCIDITNKPVTVASKNISDDVPSDALKIEIATIEINSQEINSIEIKSQENEENAAKIIRSAFENWKKETLPSCVILTTNGKPQGMFQIENHIINNDSCKNKIIIDKNIVDIKERAEVVKNKIAVVTGGAQGIGEEIVRNLAASGAIVYIADLNIDGAKKLSEKINLEENRSCTIPVQVNVSSEESVENMFDFIAQTTGGFDICISNAGVLKAGSVLEQDLSDFKFVTDINYTGFFIISKFAARVLRTQNLTAPRWKTDIIQINSKSGLEGSNKNGAYSGGKFGGLGLVSSFAMELIEYGIKVNAVCPGNFLDGPLWSDPEKGLFVQYLKTGKVPGAKSIKDVRTFYESKVPMKRGCTGKDLTRAIFYIVEQEYETGQAVPVTGGQVMLH